MSAAASRHCLSVACLSVACLSVACLALLACSTNHAALQRGQSYYEDNQYERALALWRELERHQSELGPESARYAYLRGMTDYRLGFREDARHWLALAKVDEQLHPGRLDVRWQARLDAALEDLNREVYGIKTRGSDPVQSIEAPGAVAPPASVAPPTPPAPP